VTCSITIRPFLSAAVLVCLGTGVAVACPEYDAVVVAVEADDAAAAEALFHDISVSAACDDALREWVGDYLARDSFLAAMRDGTSPEDRRAALARALTFEKHWRSYAELGRLDWQAGRFGSAAVNFQLAINELVEGDPTHAAETSEIAEVYELASASLALADGAVEMPLTRGGTIGGIFATSIRGFSVEEVELPITFRFGTTEFDERGVEYAQMLADHLIATAPEQLNLAGHTDPIGDEAFNLALSVARAEAVEDFLKSRGFSGRIETKGYGKTRIPEPPAGIEPGSEEHHRIARRVVFSVR
jgi:OmpA-OmpF porin, OOP family